MIRIVTELRKQITYALRRSTSTNVACTSPHVLHVDTLIRIADIFQLTLDELVGRKASSGTIKARNHERQALCRRTDHLPNEESRALILVMDRLITKARVGQMLYEYRRKTHNDTQATVPWLQLKGHWLARAGFSVNAPVTVRVMQGCLVLTTEDKATKC